jgi:DNA uptake protein ComE-like DNA-binding protein
MKIFESHFWYNKRQRNGILFLVSILLLLQIILFFIDFSTDENQQIDKEEFYAVQGKIDSLKRINNDSIAQRIYRFNPNFLTDFRAYQMGMSEQEIDRLLTFRKKNKYVNSPRAFQQVTGVSDSLLRMMSPLFKFPEWTQKNKHNQSSKKALDQTQTSLPEKIEDLNHVTAKELSRINGVSDKLAKRIVAYRNKLQGFYEDDQLFEVYYLNKEIGDQILKSFQVIEKPLIQKIDINSASFKEILKTPYIDYKLTQRICNYRDENIQINDLEELKKIDSFPIEKFDRIALYLSAQ